MSTARRRSRGDAVILEREELERVTRGAENAELAAGVHVESLELERRGLTTAGGAGLRKRADPLRRRGGAGESFAPG